MFKNMKLSWKLATGFGLCVALTVVVGIVGRVMSARALLLAELSTDVMNVQYLGTAAEVLYNKYLRTVLRDESEAGEYVEAHGEVLRDFRASAAEIQSMDVSAEQKAAVRSIANSIDLYEQAHRKLVPTMTEFADTRRRADEALAETVADIRNRVDSHHEELIEAARAQAAPENVQLLTRIVAVLASMERNAAATAQSQALFILEDEPKYAQQMAENVTAFEASYADAVALMKEQNADDMEEDLAILEEMRETVQRYAQQFNELVEDRAAIAGIVGELEGAIDDVARLSAETDERTAQASQATASLSNKIALGTIALTVVIGFALAMVITRSVSGSISRVTASLGEGGKQVNDAAREVSSASQTLAEGASEQASSLEETSAALEQMAAMTRTNAENAKQADALGNQAKSAAESGDQIMERLNEAMDGINHSSGEISKIIKVIEEIAFQTNLLALNAAVEAARAGEHGKGFAVVADEVRNLAQRAAQAARETTTLIEGSVNRAKDGAEVAGEVGRSLEAIVGDIGKVTDLINGIARATEEQAQGVDQVNTAVSQMDKVTQRNAASAEEAASASEQLAAQAAALNGIVGDLNRIIAGRANAAAGGAGTQGAAPTSRRAQGRVQTVARNGLGNPSTAPRANVSSEVPEKVTEGFLSMDHDDGLAEF